MSDQALECDVVLKGGITSGVIYPLAICELARTYRLRSVGGASAGAIAAAAAAAAEAGRDSGGFDRLARLPDDITRTVSGGGSVLFRLFQPQPGTRALFRVLSAGLGRTGVDRVLRTAVAVLRGDPLWVACGAAPGAATVLAGALGSGAARWAAVAGGILLLVAGAAAAAISAVLCRVGRAVPANGFGLCSGMPPGASSDARALTPWLHETLQSLAGIGRDGPPLTFGQLAARGVELRVMTTNLTQRQPLAMPWDDNTYFFDPTEFRRLFPEPVVRWLEDHPPELTGGEAEVRRTTAGRERALPLRPLPAAADLPIVVATRMSLSFPLLLAAVPLHAIDYGAPAEQDGTRPLRRNWFTDGGVCSNLPVHFFDRPLPTRPTFAIDLARFPAGRHRDTDESANSYLPDSNTPTVRRWNELDTSGLAAVGGFLQSIVDTARGWVDQSNLLMPGYRDRVVTIWHDGDEGGMNLNMHRDVVQRLAHRGEGAAAKLAGRFSTPDRGVATGWENHRWVRFRTAAAGLDAWLADFERGYTGSSPGASPYSELAGEDAAGALPSYPLTKARRAAVNARADALVRLAASWRTKPADAFQFGAPRPSPRLRLVPPEAVADLVTDRPVE